MDVSGRSWILALLGRKAVNPLSSREVSMIKSDARALIRIANKIERALSSASEINDESVAVKGDLLRNLTAAENQLMRSIAGATSASFSVRVIEQDVIRPILQSEVIVSVLAHGAIERAIRSAALDLPS
jgi:hypothetical protein